MGRSAGEGDRNGRADLVFAHTTRIRVRGFPEAQPRLLQRDASRTRNVLAVILEVLQEDMTPTGDADLPQKSGILRLESLSGGSSRWTFLTAQLPNGSLIRPEVGSLNQLNELPIFVMLPPPHS
jgi:hypothetical protein